VPAVGTLPVPLAAASVPATPEPDVDVPALPETVLPDTPPPLTPGADCPVSLPPQAAAQHAANVIHACKFEVRIL
jgi:hypothetical protein